MSIDIAADVFKIESETATRLSKRRHDYLCFTAQHDFAPMSTGQQLSVFLQDCGLSVRTLHRLCGIVVIVLIGNVIDRREQGDSGTDRDRKNVCPPHVSEKFLR